MNDRREDIRVTTRSGRTVHANYGGHRSDGKNGPGVVTLWTIAVMPQGEHRQCGRMVPVMGKLNRWELAREAEHVSARADALERGEPTPEEVHFFDLRPASERDA